MPIISIIEQPTANALKAAYRPVVLKVTATRTDGNAVPPVVYCDVYIAGIFYKTTEKTQYNVLNSSNSEWDFDIQDAIQEVLKTFLATNGATSITEAPGILSLVYCKFRSSGYDVNGFITPEGTAPIQGTGTIAPVSGTGSQSNSFFVCNSALQHDQNQDLAAHLGYYKNGTWDAAVYPLTHRPNGYKVCKGDSDYFPIVNLSTKTPLCVKLFYKNSGDSGYSSISKCGESSCVGVGIPSFTFADAIPGTAYSRSVPLSGSSPFNITYSSIPAWMSVSISGSNLVYSGTPGDGDVGTNLPVNVIVANACGSASSYKTINVVSDCIAVGISGTAQNGFEGTPYSVIFTLSGTGPFALSPGSTLPSWMSISLSANQVTISGNPGSGDVSNDNPIAFTVTNDCGSNDFTANIIVSATGVRFGTTTVRGGDALTELETANIIGGVAYATITVTLQTFTNPNGGLLKLNGSPINQGYSFTVVLDGSGNGSFNADIYGQDHPGTGMEGIFIISAISAGTFGTPDNYIISKTF